MRLRGLSDAVARFGRRSGPDPAPDRLGEEARRGFEEMAARIPPPEVYERLFVGRDARPPADPRPHYHGHRERLRTRCLESRGEGMPEYELLELVLFNAISRIDVKPLAKRLLAEFGDLGGVFAAPEARLLAVPGLNRLAVVQFRLAGAIAARLARATVRERPVISSMEALSAWCQTVLAHLPTEEFHVLFLDTKNALIADETHGRGTVNHAPAYPREVAKRALELDASAVILVHNHPSGDPTPSGADVEMTRRIETALAAMGVELHDHLVVGRGEERSFRALGLL